MNHTKGERLCRVACVLLVALAGAAHAQTEQRSCEATVARVKQADRYSRSERLADVQRLGFCGRDGTTAALAAFRAAASSRGTAWLGALTAFSAGGNGRVFLEGLVDVAANNAASVEARVVAMVSLHRIQVPQRTVAYYDMIGGYDVASAAHGCNHGTIAGAMEPSGVSRDELQRIRTVAHRIRNDTSSPTDVRTAAFCLGG
jgi:hypothetical protein